MVKMNYDIPDYWRLANNVFEAFWIPGTFRSTNSASTLADPYVAPVRQAIEQPIAIRRG